MAHKSSCLVEFRQLDIICSVPIIGFNNKSVYRFYALYYIAETNWQRPIQGYSESKALINSVEST
jgi:hypothetical protein